MDGPSLEELNGEVSLPPPPSMQSLLAKMLVDLAKQPRDIWRLSAPAALLSGVSLLEYSQYYGDHPELLKKITEKETAMERMISCVVWYISTLFSSYGSRSGGKQGGYERKPYNPILGEQFKCEWGEGAARLVAEQVSHHPPVSSFYLKTDNGVHVHGFTGQSTSFMGTGIKVRQEGRLFVYLEKWNEEITITLPELHLFGLASAPYLEITGPALLLSTSGFAADLDFQKSGYIFGEKDQFSGAIYNNDTGIVEYDIWGNWKHTVFLLPHDTFKEQGKRDGELLFSHDNSPATRPRIINQLPDLDSRVVWRPVTDALKRGDYDAADVAKNKIEDFQRALRKERSDKGVVFEPELFFFTNDYCYLPITESNNGVLSNGQSSDNGSTYSSTTASSSSSLSSTIAYNGRWICKEFQFVK